jgi:hypothetical protein
MFTVASLEASLALARTSCINKNSNDNLNKKGLVRYRRRSLFAPIAEQGLCFLNL